MEIVSEERTYEGIHAIPSLVMAVMETTGIREHIDRCCSGQDPSNRFLSPGMAVKAMVGAMVERGKRPLYRVSDYYSTAPADKLFGPMVENRSLSDTALAERLDDVFRTDRRSILLDCYGLLKDAYGFRTESIFMDASNYTMFGQKYMESQIRHNLGGFVEGFEIEDIPKPAYGGNAKDGRNDLVQMNISHVVDNNGIPMCSQSYSGNASDIAMNRDMVEFLCKTLDMRSLILMADCKLCVEEMVTSLVDSGIGFVTKVPASFNGKLRETMIHSVRNSEMDESVKRPGRRYYQSTDEVNGRKVRVVAYMLPNAERDSERFIREGGLLKATKKLRSLKSRRFFCEDDAREYYFQALGELDADCYIADTEVYRDEVAERRYDDGKYYRIRAENIRVDETKVHDAVLLHAVQVLLTNLPFSDKPSENRRAGASADNIVDLYLEQYKAEAGFKMMKSGMNIADVYIHTPSRITAMAFVVSLATMICKAMDHVLKVTKESGARNQTLKSLADVHLNTIIKYDRAHDRLSVMGSPGSTQDIFGLVERLSIDPQMLLGYRN